MSASRGISGLHILICLIGLGLYVWGFQQQTGIARLPPGFDRAALSYPVRVDGRVAATGEELRFIAEGYTSGTRLEIVEADGGTVPVVLEPGRDRAYLWITAASASVFWLFSLLAFAPRVHIPGGLYFFWITFLYGMSVAIGGTYFGGARPWYWSVPGYLQVISLAAVPVFFVQMTTVFPRRRALRDRVPWLLAVLWSAAFALAAWQVVTFHAYFGNTTPDRAARMHTAGFAADLVLVVEAAAGLALLIWQGRTAPLARERSQVRWLLRGFFIGAAPYVFLRTLPTALGLPALFPHHVDRIVELTIPAAFLLVVIRHQLLDMDVNVRRGLLYGVLANVLLAGYVFAVLLVKPIPIGVAPWISSLLWVMLGIGGGLLVGPLRRTVGLWMDRRLFHILHDHEALLEDLDLALDRADGTAGILGAMRPRLIAAFRPRRVTIIACEGEEIRVNGRTSEEDARTAMRVWRESTGSRLRTAAAPGSTDDPASESAAFPAALRERGFVLGASLRSGESAAGLILLGPRATGRHYVSRQLRLLGTIAEHAGMRLVRIELMRRVLAEQADRRRLAELHRAKTDFLARVAHDLRTPLTSISWSVQNLLDGVIGPVPEGQSQYLRSIEHTCWYQSRIVENLLRLSRLESGELEACCETIDAADVVRRSADIVAPIAHANEVGLELEIPGAPVPARGDAHLLQEALVNVLENAIRFSPRGEQVEISLANGDGQVSIRIRDRGPGLPPGAREQLFARYSQGPPSPWSSQQGYGLGLHIAHAHLTLMGGDLCADNHVEGGAVFTCSLRREEEPSA